MNNIPSTQETKWYNKPPFSFKAFIFFAFIVFFPLGIFLLWKSGKVKTGWKVIFTIVGAFFGLIVMVATFAPKTPEMIAQERREDSLAQVNRANTKTTNNTDLKHQIASYFNADTLQAYYSAAPFSLYFTKNDGVGTFSEYHGYISEEGEKEYSSDYKHLPPLSPKIEIRFDPTTKEIYWVDLTIYNFKTISPKVSDLKLAFDFISKFSPEAATQFRRNFSTVFCYTDKDNDSSEYIDSSKKMKIDVVNDFSQRAEKDGSLSTENCVIAIANIGNLYVEDTVKEAKAQQERKEILEKAFSPYDGSHLQLTEYIKAHMNDPESFEHVETTYIPPAPQDEYVTVKETFRGKNAYNATITQTIWAKCKIEGDVVEIEKQ